MLCVGLFMINSISLASDLNGYSNLKPLLLQEIDNLDGTAQGEIVGGLPVRPACPVAVQADLNKIIRHHRKPQRDQGGVVMGAAALLASMP